MKTPARIAIAAVLNIALFSISAAENVDEAPSITVKYGDLDLNRDRGLASLYVRITRAADGVCRELDPRELGNAVFATSLRARHEACIQQAVEGAVAKINSKAFTDFAAAKQAGFGAGRNIALASE
jgi:UrcA family protein